MGVWFHSSSGVAITFNGGVCCGEQPGPNLPTYPQSSSIKVGSATYTLTYTNYGGDNTGAVLLSPFIKAGTVTTTGYNHYSMLRSIEDIFGLGHLGYAQEVGVGTFGVDVFTGL
jgi:hypothetical protein